MISAGVAVQGHLVKLYKSATLFKGPFINNVRIRGEGRGLAYLVKLIKEQRGRGSKNALFARTLFMNAGTKKS